MELHKRDGRAEWCGGVVGYGWLASLSSTKPPALISRMKISRAFCVKRRDTIAAGASANTAA